MSAYSKNFGAFIKTLLALAPQSLAGSSPVNGGALNRQSSASSNASFYYSGKLSLSVGASSGSPSSYSVTAKMQHSADGSTGWADYTDPSTGNVPSVQCTADNTEADLNVDLSNAYQYVRTVVTPAFTGGTSPTSLASATLVLGGADQVPAN